MFKLNPIINITNILYATNSYKSEQVLGILLRCDGVF